MTHVPFEREELIKLRERAEGFVDACHLSQTWHRAYLALADAADHLDAMIARSSGVGGFSPNDPDQPPASETLSEPAGPNCRSVESDGSGAD